MANRCVWKALMASILNPPQPGDASFQLFEQEKRFCAQTDAIQLNRVTLPFWTCLDWHAFLTGKKLHQVPSPKTYPTVVVTSRSGAKSWPTSAERRSREDEERFLYVPVLSSC